MSQWKGYGPDNVLSSEAGVNEAGPQSAATSGSLTYEPFFGLKTKPFSLSTDPRAFYNSPIHATVLEDLLGAIRRREGLIVLTGEMGTGKTTLCRAALYQLDRKTFTTFVPDPFLSREDLLRMLLVDFGEVSVDDLRRGRLSGASRPDLSYQLYEFLTSLESVDAFAVLVIDEAQHLAAPLLEEIRALSELEAGRKLLQIVLVGQPQLQTHLKHFQMRQIDQRVSVRCELRALTKEDVAGYVAHRLATAGGVRERIAFAPAAIEMIHGASNGIPRLVNVICDRALAHGYIERVSVIGPALVAGAIDELQLMPPREPAWAQPLTIESSIVQPVTVEPVAVEPVVVQPAVVQPAVPQPPTAQAVTTQPVTPQPVTTQPVTSQPVTPEPAASPAHPSRDRRGLFEKKPTESATAHVFDLAALLDLTPIAPRQDWERAADRDRDAASAVPAWKTRMERETRHGSRFASLKTVGLALIGMALMLIAGGIAVTAQRMRPQVAAPAASQAAPQAVQAQASIAQSPPAPAQPATQPVQAPASPLAESQSAPTAAAAIAAAGSQDTWVVQAAAFSSPERSLALVQRLTQSGFPAFEVTADLGSRGVLYFVRVGPFKTAMEADDARGLVLDEIPDLEGAFVRNVTTK